MVAPSCPALVIHDDDTFRKSLIATLDQKHFTVTIRPDGVAAVDALKTRRFEVVILGVDLSKERGLAALHYLRDNRPEVSGAVILLGEPTPELRNYAKLADETLLKPVDAEYVAERAWKHCRG